MTQQPLRIGVLGYRFMGKAHANARARLPMFFPDAPDIERHPSSGATRRRSRTPRSGSDSRTPRPTGRTRSTRWTCSTTSARTTFTREPSIAALEAGVPVLCEKPLAPTLDEAAAMRDAAADADVPAGTAFNYRFIPAIRYAKGLIEDGELGEIRQVRGRYLQDWLVDPEAPWAWRMDADTAGSGALGDLGAHARPRGLPRRRRGRRDRSRLGPPPDVRRRAARLRRGWRRRGVSRRDRRRRLHRAGRLRVGRDGGLREATRFAEGHKNDHAIEIHGSKGSLKFSLERLNELEVLREDDRGYQTVLVTDETDPYVDHWWPPGHVIGWEHTFVHENYEFLSAVAEAASSSRRSNRGTRCKTPRRGRTRRRAREWVSVE